ncbi:hypothetical protein KKF34_15945 [Myxococcota bacterium]|nr:hypothetical protein [Myxococcota bacterium]MBU1380437.1 hypothetical protein [Myxococcota bacterium]MBU1498369.1 hypothetical protein [Myxococcota bacterium]
MLNNYSIQVVENICVVRYHHKPTFSEVLSSINDASNMGEFNRRLWIYEDTADLQSDEIQKVASLCKAKWPVPSKVAIVTPNDHSFGLARMHDVYREQEGVETRVFRTEIEAIVWLSNDNSMRNP